MFKILKLSLVDQPREALYGVEKIRLLHREHLSHKACRSAVKEEMTQGAKKKGKGKGHRNRTR